MEEDERQYYSDHKTAKPASTLIHKTTTVITRRCNTVCILSTCMTNGCVFMEGCVYVSTGTCACCYSVAIALPSLGPPHRVRGQQDTPGYLPETAALPCRSPGSGSTWGWCSWGCTACGGRQAVGSWCRRRPVIPDEDEKGKEGREDNGGEEMRKGGNGE